MKYFRCFKILQRSFLKVTPQCSGFGIFMNSGVLVQEGR